MSGVSLYEEQVKALSKMHDGCILAGEVGSGKSRTSLAYFYTQYGGEINSLNYIDMKDPSDLYIITTAAKRDSLEWDTELIPFLMGTNPDVSYYPNQKVVIDSWQNIGKYAKVTDSFFIFDEQKVTGRGKWANTFVDIGRKNRWILLSATPGDKWEEYWAVFVANGFFKCKTDYFRKHIIQTRYGNIPRTIGYINERKLYYLKYRLIVKMPRSRPYKMYHKDIYNNYDVAKYKEIIKTRWNPYLDKPIESPTEFCNLLRRVVNSDASRMYAVSQIHGIHKKVIIFYNFNYELDILRNLEYDEDTVITEWNGQKHDKLSDSDNWVHLVHYLAGAEGWNCIKTNAMIFFSQNYSYKIMSQAAGRIDRLNTPYKELYYYHLKSRSSIDVAISKSLKEKELFNEKEFAG